jgi:hypothetical protein
MFCHACGTEVPNGKRYCQQCGTAQLAASADKGRRANWRLSAWVVGGAVVVSLGVGGVIGYVAARSAVAASAEATAIRVEEQYEAAAEEQRARSFKLGYDAGAASTEVPGGGQFIETGNGFNAKPSSNDRYYFVRFERNPSEHNAIAPLAIAAISKTTYDPTRWTGFKYSTWDVADW